MAAFNCSSTTQPIELIYPDNAPQGFHLLAKPTGAICNLDCAYCFFLDKEVFYPGSKFRMSDDMLEQYIRQLIESHRTDQVSIAWQGGEPTLMGLDFYRKAITLAEKYRRPGMTFLHTMQTNGTLLTDEWAEFFKEHDFLIGLSIDGPRELHDIYRVDKGGQPTFDKVMRGLRLLQKHGIDFNVLTTVNRVNADYPLEVYRFIRDEIGADWSHPIGTDHRRHQTISGELPRFTLAGGDTGVGTKGRVSGGENTVRGLMRLEARSMIATGIKLPSIGNNH
jgi:anaerobic sulfatase-maturating enzyme